MTMEHIEKLTALGLFDARAPRYTSYPAAPVFAPQTGAALQSEWLSKLPPTIPVSVYVHIPFCERLCWFCACRTQGTRTLSPVEAYLDTVIAELQLLRAALPAGLRMGRLHWGGGTPTILPPSMIRTLSRAIKDVIPPTDDFEFSVEIDPTMVDDAKIAALASEGMNRASIGIQDFSPAVQAAIGRDQPYSATLQCVNALRNAGITSLNADLVYGLPHQDLDTMSATIAQVLTLSPERIALFGYAHVPHMAKRQKLIDEAALPDEILRYRLAESAAAQFQTAGFKAIGIDHFARPEDSLAIAADTHSLRRNFQGYTTDDCQTLIGIGASSISRFSQGYVQNASATPAYIQRIEAGELAGARGHVLSDDDQLRARAIEMLMCDFKIDRDALRRAFGTAEGDLIPVHQGVVDAFPDCVTYTHDAVTILPEGKPLTRLIARAYDKYTRTDAIYSKAS
jgi:oxygen-independent coproporphyrinogen-3 oxidase